MKTSESINKITPALIKARREMPTPNKDGLNPHFRSKYTTLDELLRCVNKGLLANGMVMMPLLLEEGTKVGCKIRVFHESGEWIESPAFYLPAQQTSQGIGSASTYVLRYCISSMFSMGTIDPNLEDDGTAAMPPKKVEAVAPKHPAPNGPAGPIDKTKAIKTVDDMRKACGVTDKNFTEMLERDFNKSALSFLTLDELRRVFKFMKETNRAIKEVMKN